MRREKDYYTILGVGREADAGEIQKAYRKLARKYHPDVNKEHSDGEMFKLVNEAHSVLTDPEKRRLYDTFGDKWQEAHQYEEKNGKGSAGSGGSSRMYSNDGAAYGGEDLNDIFSSIFGAGSRTGGWGRHYQQEGQTIEADLEVSLHDLLNGAKKTITLQAARQAAGAVVDEILQVTIPPGLKDGSVIRLTGKGGTGFGGAKNGDLLLRLKVASDGRFSTSGYNLVTTVPITPWEAALGGKIEVQTLTGAVNLNIPAGTRSGRTFRLKGKGLPRKAGSAGDLLVVVETQVPEKPTAEEKRLFNELKEKSVYNPRKSAGQRAPRAKAAPA